MPKRVVVAQGSKVIIAWIRIAAATVLQPIGQGDIVIAAHHLHPSLLEQRIDSVRVGAKTTQITETKQRFCAPLPRVRNSRCECQVVIVHPAKDCNTPIVHRVPLNNWRRSCPSRNTY